VWAPRERSFSCIRPSAESDVRHSQKVRIAGEALLAKDALPWIDRSDLPEGRWRVWDGIHAEIAMVGMRTPERSNRKPCWPGVAAV
jgi:hypothetical protein